MSTGCVMFGSAVLPFFVAFPLFKITVVYFHSLRVLTELVIDLFKAWIAKEDSVDFHELLIS